MNLVALVILLGVVATVVARQLGGRGPPIWTVFGVGGLLVLATGALSLPAAGETLLQAAPVLLFLLALFLLAGALERSGALEHVARWLVGRPRRPEGLPALLFLGFGVASAFIVNDALVLLAIPILFSVSRRLEIDPKPLLLTVAFAVTVGSAMTPLGNPQNLLVSLSSGIGDPMTTFLRYLFLPIGASLLVGGWYLTRAFRRTMRGAGDRYAEVRATRPAFWPHAGWGARLGNHPVLVVFPAFVVSAVALELSASFLGTPGVSLWVPALGGAGVVLLATPGRIAVLRYTNVPILLLFVGLFLVVGAAEAGGVIGGIETLLPIAGPSQLPQGVLGIFGTSLLGSQLVSNVPWTAIQIPVLTGLGYGAGQPTAWLSLAAASTLAGNITVLGAASNLILVERAEQLGVRIRLGEFVRYALPVAAISVAFTLAALLYGV